MKKKTKKRSSTLPTKPKYRLKNHQMLMIAVLIILAVTVSGLLILRYSEAGKKVYTIGELDDIYLLLRDNPRRIGPYPDPESPRGRERIRYTQHNNTKSWNAGCFVALTPEGARVLSFKFGDTAHFSTRRWVQTDC